MGHTNLFPRKYLGLSSVSFHANPGLLPVRVISHYGNIDYQWSIVRYVPNELIKWVSAWSPTPRVWNKICVG